MRSSNLPRKIIRKTVTIKEIMINQFGEEEVLGSKTITETTRLEGSLLIEDNLNQEPKTIISDKK
jgi:hypothetical protein